MTQPTRPLLVALVTIACTHVGPAPAPFVEIARQAPPPPWVLVEAPLAASQSFDALLDAFVRVGGEEELLPWLQQAAERLEPSELARNPGARLLVVHAVFRMVRAPGFNQRFDAIRGIVDTLQNAAPDAPETIFARAFLRWVLLADGAGHLALNSMDRAIAVDLAHDLKALVSKFPQFAGPAEFDHTRLARELAATEVLLAETATPTAEPLAATPTAAPIAATPAAP